VEFLGAMLIQDSIAPFEWMATFELSAGRLQIFPNLSHVVSQIRSSVKVSVRGSGAFLSSSTNRQYQPALPPACGLVGMSLDENRASVEVASASRKAIFRHVKCSAPLIFQSAD
jgi:hypothetical protein